MKENILKWSNLTVTTKNLERVIINELYGEIKSGQSLAILGHSGSGKTTFLNFLSKRNRKPNLIQSSGEIQFYLNNKETTESWHEISAFVNQDDFLFDVLTPYEVLSFAAEMKLAGKSKKERLDLIQQLIAKLSLEQCKNVRIGSVLKKGISSGEKKRTAIGYELITDPYVLFLDEPTTGLDSKSAYNVCKLITDDGKMNKRIIIFSIHQPNTEVYKLFDQLMILAEGKCIYFGKSQHSIEYFKNMGYICPLNYNPPEYYMKILRKENINMIEEDEFKNGKKRLDEREKDFKVRLNSLAVECKNHILEHYSFRKSSKDEIHRDLIQIERNSSLRQFKILFKRNLKLCLRDRKIFFTRLSMNIVNSLIAILVFSSLGFGDTAVIDRKGCLFFIVTSVVNANLQSNFMIFHEEKMKFYKEQDSKMYGVIPYYLSKTILEIPMQIIMALIVYLFTYSAFGLNSFSSEKYFIYFFTIFLAGYCGSSFAIFIASLFDDIQLIPAFFPFIFYAQIQAAGYFVSQSNTPLIFYPIRLISIFRYAYQALCWNEFTDIDLQCMNKDRCRLPMEDFKEDLFWSIIPLILLSFMMNLLSVTALKVRVWMRSFQ
jgi:ABC-type multidrug transport system ATPase subunit